MLTLLACQMVSALPQFTVAALRSIMLPEIGPAVVEFPIASATEWLAVEALAVSVPASTLVESVKLASLESARPEPPSLALQEMLTLLACQMVSALPQFTVAALRSIMKLNGPTVVEFPATSVIVLEPVGALASSSPLATLVLSENVASAAFAKPEVASLDVHDKVTLPFCHPVGPVAQFATGLVLSTLAV
jgi:hypothetical protein